MLNILLAKLNRFIPLFLPAIIYMLCLSGCTEPASSGSNLDLLRTSSKLESEWQTDRPPTAKTLYAMADILTTQGRDSESEVLLKRIIREYPEFLPAYNSLAELQMRQGRINEAIETINSGLRIRPEDPVLLNNLGMCWTIRRDYEKALAMFTTASGIMPENARYRANMAVALGLLGRYQESLSLFEQILPEEQAKHNIDVIRRFRKDAEPDSAKLFEYLDLEDIPNSEWKIAD